MDEKRNERPFLSILINIIIPVIILTKFSGESALGPLLGLLVALAFPFCYGIFELVTASRTNLFSVIGIISVLLTGSIGFFELDSFWIAIKEASIPLVLGIAVFISAHTRSPLAYHIVKRIIKMDKVRPRIKAPKKKAAFRRSMAKWTYLLSTSFFISALLNYVLAKMIVDAPAGSEEFNRQIGVMTGLSFPVIVVPLTVFLIFIFMRMIGDVSKITSIESSELMGI